MPATTTSKHDSAGWRNVPKQSKPVDQKRVQELLKTEWARFEASTKASGDHNKKASKVLPLGVTSSFQHWDPYPISIVSAKGAYLTDVDGRKLLDLSMGFGAMLVGHLNPKVIKKVKKAIRSTGTLFVTPSPTATDVAEKFKKRFDLDMLRFTNSGTESTMYAIRTARAVKGRNGVIKVEGGYHGGYDPLQVSVKPALNEIGDANLPTAQVPPEVEAGDVYVVPYNNLESLEKIMKHHGKKIACFMIEPVIENLSIILPDEGYLKSVRELCDKYDIALIFDEVKTGLTAGVAGAAARLGVKPDLITLAKSIGGGFPLAAFGGKQEYMDAVVDNRMAHFGTYNGNPLVMAAADAVDEICTPAALASAEAINNATLAKLAQIIAEFELPAHTIGLGVKGAMIWSPDPVRNYRDYKATDFETAELSWLWGVNRGVLTPPGLDEQWLVSLAHTQKDMDKMVASTRELAAALRA
ncbi:MAG: aminotransferase class III-fold pyridoxal phosphate-dependent enzyme [Aquiluna sp.]|nr:aminotransferase class III-fold pyridoxal phosphate-dependent enzyme [Aquiluna sp.]